MAEVEAKPLCSFGLGEGMDGGGSMGNYGEVWLQRCELTIRADSHKLYYLCQWCFYLQCLAGPGHLVTFQCCWTNQTLLLFGGWLSRIKKLQNGSQGLHFNLQTGLSGLAQCSRKCLKMPLGGKGPIQLHIPIPPLCLNPSLLLSFQARLWWPRFPRWWLSVPRKEWGTGSPLLEVHCSTLRMLNALPVT